MSPLLSRDAILAADDLPYTDVPVPEWGGTVRIRTMTGAERDAWELSVATEAGGEVGRLQPNIRARLVSLCAVDEENRRLFSDNDIAALTGKSASALDRLFEVALELSGLGKAHLDAMGKDSAATPSGDSRLTSPNASGTLT